MNILTINTTTQICTVGIATATFEESLESEQVFQHGEQILGFIDILLKRHQLQLAALDLLAVVCGPGSFVGTRLGCAVAQAIAYGAELPVILISTLQALAQSAYLATGHSKITVLQDARMSQVHMANFQLQAPKYMDFVDPAKLVRLTEVAIDTTGLLVGDAVTPWLGSQPCLPEAKISLSGLLSLTRYQWLRGYHVAASEVLPKYL